MKKHLFTLSALVVLLCAHLSFATGSTSAANGSSWASSSARVAAPTATLTQQPCESTSQCFVFSYKGFVVSTDGKTVTLTFGIKTNCNRDLSYAAFELPSGASATATGTRKFKYKAGITKNPFPSIKFEGIGMKGYKNGISDEFKYVMKKADFDKLTTIRVQVKAATFVGTVTFEKDCHIPKCVVNQQVRPTNVKYTVNGMTTSTTSTNLTSQLQKAVRMGQKLKMCFTVPKSSGYSTYSLVSYTAPAATFIQSLAHLQEVFDYQTITVGPNGGNVCLEIKVPSCFFQVDFVKGCIIRTLGPYDTNPTNFYYHPTQNRLLAFANGGNNACIPTKPEDPEKLGNEGCTPGYWKQAQHFGNWAPNVPTGTGATRFFDVFSVCNENNESCKYQGLPKNMTLLEALNRGGGGFNALARHAAAAYLNASSPNVAYSIKKTDLIVGVVNAFKTGNPAFKDVLEKANEKGCPLGRSELTSTRAKAIESQDMPESDQLTTFPSPFTDMATIEFTLPKTENYTISLYDMKGSLIKQLKSGTAQAGEVNRIEVDGRNMAEGLYLARMVSDSGARTIRLLLRKQ